MLVIRGLWIVRDSINDFPAGWRCSKGNRSRLGAPATEGRSQCTCQAAGNNRTLFNVFDPGRRVHFQLPTTLAKQELDGSKVSFVDLDVLIELIPIVAVTTAGATDSTPSTGLYLANT